MVFRATPIPARRTPDGIGSATPPKFATREREVEVTPATVSVATRAPPNVYMRVGSPTRAYARRSFTRTSPLRRTVGVSGNRSRYAKYSEVWSDEARTELRTLLIEVSNDFSRYELVIDNAPQNRRLDRRLFDVITGV
jgi:hypothetical protein